MQSSKISCILSKQLLRFKITAAFPLPGVVITMLLSFLKDSNLQFCSSLTFTSGSLLFTSGSFNDKSAQWLLLSLANLKQHSTNITDTFTFLYKISNHNLASQTMVSFDVNSPFANIPLSFTLNLILEFTYVDKSTE